MPETFEIVSLNYVSIYVKDVSEALEFYGAVFGKPTYQEDEGRINGFRMGNTWLTVFSSNQGTAPGKNPRNTEFAIQVKTPGQVDILHAALTIRIDIYCPLSKPA